MRKGLSVSLAGAMAALVVLLVMPVKSAAQDQGFKTDERGPSAHQMTPQEYAARQAEIRKEAAAKPTPRLPDGHPDLSGVWAIQGPGGAVTTDADGGRHVIFPTRTLSKDQDPDGISVYYNQEADNNARRMADKNKPPYKPELLAKVQELDRDSNQKEPFCVPSPPPRSFPTQISATTRFVAFLYGGENSSQYRIIPTDGSVHPQNAYSTYMGDSVGHWEGDTLVIDVTNFNDKTWLGGGGYFHSDAMHVVERFTREGDVLHYQATVEDPNVFTRPWVVNPRDVLRLTDGKYVYEDLPCTDQDRPHFVNHDHF